MAIDVDFCTFQQVSSRREDRRTKTRVGRSLTCCNESIEVLGLQSGVGGDQRRPHMSLIWLSATCSNTRVY